MTFHQLFVSLRTSNKNPEKEYLHVVKSMMDEEVARGQMSSEKAKLFLEEEKERITHIPMPTSKKKTHHCKDKSLQKKGELDYQQELVLAQNLVLLIEQAPLRKHHYVISGTDFHIHHSAYHTDLQNQEGQECKVLEEFYRAWMMGEAQLHRGIVGCHFSLPTFRLHGRLSSEGMMDQPEFTMFGTKTRWLPAIPDSQEASSIACGCADSFTLALTKENWVPMGVVVTMSVGYQKNLPIAWFNSSEIQVKGPLETKGLASVFIVWTHADFGRKTVEINVDPQDLPPVRPYQPQSEEEIQKWWKKCEEWKVGFEKKYKNYFSQLTGISVEKEENKGEPEIRRHLLS